MREGRGICGLSKEVAGVHCHSGETVKSEVDRWELGFLVWPWKVRALTTGFGGF